MFAKFAIICTLAAAASAISPGYLSSAYALGSQAEQTYRGYGGLSSVSKQAKAIDSAYATVRKSDIRLTNDASAYAPHQVAPLTFTHHGNAYATPTYTTQGYAAQPTFGYQAPAGTITYARHGYGPATLAHGYAPSTVSHHGFTTSPQATVSHHGYPSIGYAQRAPQATTVAHHGYPTLGYAQRAISTAPATATLTKVQSGLGVSYSPATSVAHSTFSGYGIQYGY